MVEKVLQNNLTYILNENQFFSEIEYRVVQNYSIQAGLVKCYIYKSNGHIAFWYQTGQLRRLDQILDHMEENTVFTVVSRLFFQVASIMENGFLDSRKIIYELNHIFVDVKTYNPYLIYLPVQNTEQIWDNRELNLRANLIRQVDRAFPEPSTSDKMQKLKNILTNTFLSPKEVAEEVRNLIGNKQLPEIQQEINYEKNKRNLAKTIFVIANSANGQRIVLKQDKIILGRLSPDVEGVICPRTNKSVGRKHCKITCIDGKYYIEDLNSVNGTWLDGEKLKPGEKKILKDGMFIKIANLIFTVMTQEEDC